MPLPTKPYPDVDHKVSVTFTPYGGTPVTLPNGEGFLFKTRDPAAEMAYTTATLKEILDPTGDWASAENKAATVMKNRFTDVANTLSTNARTEYTALLNTVKNDVYGGTPVTPNVAYAQYLNGMSSAFGGGHSSVAVYANLASQQTQLAVHEAASRLAQTVMAQAYEATRAMPLVVPVESQMVADACASAVEAHAAGQIRSQQVRQTVVAGTELNAITEPAIVNGPQTPADEVVMYGSIWAQGGAATTT